MRTKVFLILVLVCAVCVGCVSKHDEQARLESCGWKLLTLNKKSVPLAREGSRFTIFFKDSLFYGESECNSFSGDYVLKGGDKISFNVLQVTNGVCRDQALEQRFLKMLDETTRMEFRGDTLIFRVGRKQAAAFVPYLLCSGVGPQIDPELYYGIYKGVYPSGDGPGVDVTLELKADGDYELVMNYIDKGNRFVQMGKYVIHSGKLMLESEEGVQYFALGKGELKQLTPDGLPITGELEAWYVLKKIY